MNRAQKLLEDVQAILEYDPFGPLGYRITKHTYISPKDKKFLLRKRKRIGDRIETNLPGEKKRIVSVYQHQDQHLGHIEHRTSKNYPLDSHYYELEKTNDKQSTGNNKKVGRDIGGK